VSGTLLECARCGLRDVIYLDEAEAEFYHANGYIYRTCKRCDESTIWNEAAYEPLETMRRTSPPLLEHVSAPGTRKTRQHNRIRCSLRACIRYKQNYGEEVLEVNDVSRGGVSFTTQKCLTPGTRIEIAVPYSPGMDNIFLLAEIVRVKPLPNKNLYLYGAAYIKRP